VQLGPERGIVRFLIQSLAVQLNSPLKVTRSLVQPSQLHQPWRNAPDRQGMLGPALRLLKFVDILKHPRQHERRLVQCRFQTTCHPQGLGSGSRVAKPLMQVPHVPMQWCMGRPKRKCGQQNGRRLIQCSTFDQEISKRGRNSRIGAVSRERCSCKGNGALEVALRKALPRTVGRCPLTATLRRQGTSPRNAVPAGPAACRRSAVSPPHGPGRFGGRPR